MKKIFMALLLGLTLPATVNAAEVIIDCPETTNPGEEITCNVNLNSNEEIIGFEADVTTSTSLVYKNYTKANGWAGDSSKNKFLIYGNKISGNNINLGTYTYLVSKEASGILTVTFSNFKIADSNTKPLTAQDSVEEKIRVRSTDNTLSSLTVSGATLNFSKDTTTYNVEVDNNVATISATPTDQYATVTGIGNINLNYGSNKVDITVTAENGTTKVYTINITRPDNRSNNNNLKALSLNNGSINFDANKTTYDINIDASTTAITAEAEDSKATISGAGVKNLGYGVNKFDITVTAENGQTKTYTINVTRNDGRDSNNYLATLTTNVGIIDFTKEKMSYTLSVPNNIEEATINATTESAKSQLSGPGTHKLIEGENKFVIKVVAENETIKEYNITIIREKLENLTENNSLKNLVVEGHNLIFNKNTKDYSITTKEDKLNLVIELENNESTYEVIGNENLKDGSIVQIVVTDKDGNNNIYRLKINKIEEQPQEEKEQEQEVELPQKENINLIPKIMTGLLIVLSIIFVILLSIKLVNNKKKKENNQKQ